MLYKICFNIVCQFLAISDENWFAESYLKFQGAVIVPSLRQDNDWSLKLWIALSNFRQKWLKIGTQYSKHIL